MANGASIVAYRVPFQPKKLLLFVAGNPIREQQAGVQFHGIGEGSVEVWRIVKPFRQHVPGAMDEHAPVPFTDFLPQKPQQQREPPIPQGP